MWIWNTDSGGEAFLRSRHYLLQSQIRRAAVNFIKETLVGLPSLPTEEALLLLQENRRKDIARRVEEERRKAQEARLKFKLLQVIYYYYDFCALACNSFNTCTNSKILLGKAEWNCQNIAEIAEQQIWPVHQVWGWFCTIQQRR